MKSVNWLYVVLMFVPGTLWGIAFLTNEFILPSMPPFTIAMCRNILATIALVCALLYSGGRLPRFGFAWWPYLVVGAFDNAVPFMFTVWAQQYVDSGLATIFVATTPFFTLMLARLFIGDEHITVSKAVGVLLGMVGILVLIGPDALKQLGVNFWSQLALLSASGCYAIATVFSRKYIRADQQQQTVLEWLTGQFIVATLITIVVAFSVEDVFAVRPDTQAIIALAVAAWVIGIFAFFCYYRLNSLAGPTYASFVTYLIPINGVIWGALILGETITRAAIVALCLILLGVAVINNLIRLPNWQ